MWMWPTYCSCDFVRPSTHAKQPSVYLLLAVLCFVFGVINLLILILVCVCVCVHLMCAFDVCVSNRRFIEASQQLKYQEELLANVGQEDFATQPKKPSLNVDPGAHVGVTIDCNFDFATDQVKLADWRFLWELRVACLPAHSQPIEVHQSTTPLWSLVVRVPDTYTVSVTATHRDDAPHLGSSVCGRRVLRFSSSFVFFFAGVFFFSCPHLLS
jgi:hypothetical protein